MKGNGYATIAETINLQGYKTKKNMGFSTNSVKRILKKPIQSGKI